ncbi:MerR family transcriptional regulator [Nocardia terpenica]|uniref:MerR family transcriptional regulator n=1 Tax=Nocardia terpenica TaxID=455432 RepID=A0A6G9ZAQ9_9NOCA|nr:MerR family transcriptional regulator [Nocardia terpenica]
MGIDVKPSKTWRPVDLAREHALSTQAVRNYEDLGALPPAERTDTGYRRYTDLHAHALRTFLALRAGYGHQAAVDLMRSAHRDDQAALYTRLDELHAGFLHERRTHAEVTAALAALDDPPPPRHSAEPLTVGQLAHRVGVHPATLRQWEKAGIIEPPRDRATGYRTYGATDIRDAHLARYLRKGGIPLRQIASFVRELRQAGDTDRMRPLLTDWATRLSVRSRNALHGVAQLDRYLTELDDARSDR